MFQDKETRYGYIDSFLDSFLGMQIRVLREQRGWTQTELAERADMKQTRISLLESMNYSGWSVDVLRRLSKAFNLRLIVKFEDFGSFTKQYLEDYDRENLERRSFDDDIIFNSEKRNDAVNSLSSHEILQPYQSNNVFAAKTTNKKARTPRNNSTGQSHLPFETLQDVDIENTLYLRPEPFSPEFEKTEPNYRVPVQELTGVHPF